MTSYDNTNRGALFSERDKKTKDDDRDYSGSINVGGTEYWLSAWIKTSKKGVIEDYARGQAALIGADPAGLAPQARHGRRDSIRSGVALSARRPFRTKP